MNKRSQIFIVIVFGAIVLGLLFSILIPGEKKITSKKTKSKANRLNVKEVDVHTTGLQFKKDIYFWGLTSVVYYNEDVSGRSNKDSDCHDYLNDVSNSINTILLKNPTLKAYEIERTMVNASGNKMNPEITIEGAKNQVARIAKARNISAKRIDSIISEHVENRLIGCLGPKTINVIMLNTELDSLDK